MAMWYSLENFRCPVAGCDGGQGPNKWICYEDGSLIKIAQTGYLKCSNNVGGNAAHYGQICQWRWDCGRHGDHPFNRFHEADYQGFVFALSHAVQLTTTAGANWVATLCAELEKQYKSVDIKPQVYNSDRTHGNSIGRNVTDFRNPHGYNQGRSCDVNGVTQKDMEHVICTQQKTTELDRQFEDPPRKTNTSSDLWTENVLEKPRQSYAKRHNQQHPNDHRADLYAGQLVSTHPDKFQRSPGDFKGVTEREHVLSAQHKTAELDRQFEDPTRRANPPRIRLGDVKKGDELIRSTRSDLMTHLRGYEDDRMDFK